MLQATEIRPSLLRALVLTFRSDCGDENADSGSDERRLVPDGLEALGLDEGRDILGELVEVSLDIVLEDETGQRSGGFILRPQLGQNVDQVAVEVRVSVELLELLLHGSLRRCVRTLGLSKKLQDLLETTLFWLPIHLERKTQIL